jgi:eIF3 subunit 6 N terminal domain
MIVSIGRNEQLTGPISPTAGSLINEGRLRVMAVIVENKVRLNHKAWTDTLDMAEYDISQKLIPFMDRHLAFPVLAHLSELSLFPEEDVRFAQYELARGTNMVDFTLDLFQQLYPDQDPPPGCLCSLNATGHSLTKS